MCPVKLSVKISEQVVEESYVLVVRNHVGVTNYVGVLLLGSFVSDKSQ